MTEDEAFRLFHTLTLLFFMTGWGATMVPLYRGWRCEDLQAQVYAFREASRNQVGLLLPGLISVGVTGIIWGIRSDRVDPVETGWLLTVEALYLVMLFVCLPAMAASLRRVRLLALQAQKSGTISQELKDTLTDSGALVFGTLMLLLVSLILVLVIVKPY